MPWLFSFGVSVRTSIPLKAGRRVLPAIFLDLAGGEEWVFGLSSFPLKAGRRLSGQPFSF